MICVPGMSLDGYLGEKVIIHARQAIGLAMALERHAARFFGNGGIVRQSGSPRRTGRRGVCPAPKPAWNNSTRAPTASA